MKIFNLLLLLMFDIYGDKDGFTLAFNRNDLFQQSLRRQKGTRTQKEEGAIRHVAWQEEANEVSTENPRLKKNAVAEQVRINLGYKGPADTIAGVIKIPKK